MTSPSRNGSERFLHRDSSTGSRRQPSNRQPPPYSQLPFAYIYTHPSRQPRFTSSGGPNTPSSFGVESTAETSGPDSDMDSPASGTEAADVAREWDVSYVRTSSRLPAFPTRAGGAAATSDAAMQPPKGREFFVPTYLAGSSYIQRLQDAHVQQDKREREAKRTKTKAPPSTLMPLPSGSHRGMSHTIVERSPTADDDDPIAPLPTRWNHLDVHGPLIVEEDGVGLKLTSHPAEQGELEAYGIRADQPMPPECGIYYYEVQIMSGKREDLTVAVGFATKTASLSRPIGWEHDAWGYHGDDGRCFLGHHMGRSYGPKYNTGDTIGCGINFRDNTAFFTRNGKLLGTAFHDKDLKQGKMYPAISLKAPGEHVRTNFGQMLFAYNIDGMMDEQRANLMTKVDATPTRQLEPKMGEKSLTQALVLQFLQHEGYVETARALAEEMRSQQEALNLDPGTSVPGVNVRDDQDAINRQRIRRAVLEGDVDKGLKLTNAYYPRVLQEHEQVNFRLRCQKFIEMVRNIAQRRMVAEPTKSNGHGPEMDIDFNGNDSAVRPSDESMDMEPGVDSSLLELEQEMLEYGKKLQAEYANDTRQEVIEVLGEIWALVAYENPLKAVQVRHLLEKKGRVAISEDLNSAILRSLGKSSRASLETIFAQTSVLLDELRHDGGEGCFISAKGIVSAIPEQPEL